MKRIWIMTGICLMLFLSGCGGKDNSLPSFEFKPLEFPFTDPNKILKMTAFNTPNWGGTGVFHNGIDLAIDKSGYPQMTTPVKLVAPAHGLIREIKITENPYNLGQYMFSIEIYINQDWSVTLVLEPSLGNGETQTAQSSLISVNQNQVVNAGDEIGYLLDGKNDYSHLHYMVNQNGQAVCAYDYSSEAAKSIFNQIAASTGSPISY